MILRQRIDVAVGAGVQVLNALIVLAHINAFGGDIIIELEEQVVLHVHLNGVGVHPEHVRHLAAGSAGLEQGPVVIPVNNFYVDFDAASLGPLVGDLLDTRLLVSVPDIDGNGAGLLAGAGTRVAGTAAGSHNTGYHQDCENKSY